MACLNNAAVIESLLIACCSHRNKQKLRREGLTSHSFNTDRRNQEKPE